MRNFDSEIKLKNFLKKEAKRLNINITAAYSTFFARELLYKLSKHQGEELILKGSSAEIAYLGRLVRAITDVDLATPYSYSEGLVPLIEAIDKKEENNINFEFNPTIGQTKNGIYKLALKGSLWKLRKTVKIDYQTNYSRLIEPTYRVFPSIFEGDEPFELYMPSFEEYLAEKLCIIVESNKEGVLNTRVKDFYDIYQLHGGKYDFDKLTEYFKKMIELRGKTTLEESNTSMLNKEFIQNHQQVWDHAKDRYSFNDHEIDLDGAVYYTKSVINEQMHKLGYIRR